MTKKTKRSQFTMAERLAWQKEKLKASEANVGQLIYDVSNTSKHSKFDLKFEMPDVEFLKKTYDEVSEEFAPLFFLQTPAHSDQDVLANWFLGMEKAIEEKGECRVWKGRCKLAPFGKGSGRHPVMPSPEGTEIVMVREWYFYLKTGVRPKTSYLLQSCDTGGCVAPHHMRAGDCPKLQPYIGYEELGTGQFDRSMTRTMTDEEILLLHQLVNGVGFPLEELQKFEQFKEMTPERIRYAKNWKWVPPFIDIENWDENLCEYTWRAHVKFINTCLVKILEKTGWESLNPHREEYDEEEDEKYANEHAKWQRKYEAKQYHPEFMDRLAELDGEDRGLEFVGLRGA